VEINPKVVPVGREYFDLHPEQMRITIGDGRYFVNATTNQYDAIILDAFLGDSSPSHLMTREAFANMRRILRPKGVLVINSFGDFAPGKDFFMGSLSKTLSSVFASVRIHTTGNGNVFFVASQNPELALHPVSIEDAHPSVRNDVVTCLANVVHADPASGRVLTDDFNPVDFYDAANREAHRRELAFSIRQNL
jgi:spermidine synthase